MSDKKEEKSMRLPTRFAVVTISDKLTKEDDDTGGWLMEEIPRRGHEVTQYSIVGENESAIRTAVQTMVHGDKVDVIITMGGTGITDRDCLPEALSPLIEKHLLGFGELFRQLSYREIGSAAMFSRAFAGRMGRTAVFCLPAAKRAVELALSRLILPELDHLVAMIKKRSR